MPSVLDVVVIYLGTNDAGDRYSLPAQDVAGAVGRLVRIVQTSEVISTASISMRMATGRSR